MNLEHIAQISFKLFWIIDIIGGLPIFISLMNRFGKIQTEKAALVSACLMIIFLFAGYSPESLCCSRGFYPFHHCGGDDPWGQLS